MISSVFCYSAVHLGINVLSLQVFINPMVASLPQHAHLFAEHGCFGGKDDNGKIHVDCSDKERARGGENLTPLPEGFKPLKIEPAMDDAWIKVLKDNNIITKKENAKPKKSKT